MELEAFQLASQQRAKPVRSVFIEETEEETAVNSVKQVSCDDIKQCLQECLEDCFQKKGIPGKTEKVGWRSPKEEKGDQRELLVMWEAWSHATGLSRAGEAALAPAFQPSAGKWPIARLKGQRLARETDAPSKVYKTGSGLGPSYGLVTPGSVGGSSCILTVDTGSNISIVHPEILQRSSIRATIQPVESQLRTVTEETAPILGRTSVQLTVGSFQAKQEMWVAEIADECILGLDFLQQHDC